MSITFKSGNLFEENAEAVVNTVNCVGVMGKGVALEFKNRWPKNYAIYKKHCDAKALRPGMVLIYDQGGLIKDSSPRYLVNFPTKDHWRSKSKTEYIVDGLKALRVELVARNIRSVAMPPLGCGNGGLDWEVVKGLIASELSDLDVDVIVFEPLPERDKPEHADSSRVDLTYRRAVLLKVLGDLEPLFSGGFDRLSLQKITYFLQEFGVDFGLRFDRNKFGPYSEPLKKVFTSLEKQGAMAGFIDDPQVSHITKAGYAAADEFLISDSGSLDVPELTAQVSRLIEGFESPYGLELLSTVHHLVKYEGCDTFTKVLSEFHNWSQHKKEKFSEVAIKNAFQRLSDDGLIASQVAT